MSRLHSPAPCLPMFGHLHLAPHQNFSPSWTAPRWPGRFFAALGWVVVGSALLAGTAWGVARPVLEAPATPRTEHPAVQQTDDPDTGDAMLPRDLLLPGRTARNESITESRRPFTLPATPARKAIQAVRIPAGDRDASPLLRAAPALYRVHHALLL